ncbi:putative heat shock protein 70 family protein [Tanacetum coccineum]
MTLVEISFDIDENGILTVTTKVLSTGKTKILMVTNENRRLSPEEIEKIVADAKKYKHDDETFKEKEHDALHDFLCDDPTKSDFETQSTDSLYSSHGNFNEFRIEKTLKDANDYTHEDGNIKKKSYAYNASDTVVTYIRRKE